MTQEDGPLIFKVGSKYLPLYQCVKLLKAKTYYSIRENVFLEEVNLQHLKLFIPVFKRVGFQPRSSPQNNFRRIIATIIDAGKLLL